MFKVFTKIHTLLLLLKAIIKAVIPILSWGSLNGHFEGIDCFLRRLILELLTAQFILEQIVKIILTIHCCSDKPLRKLFSTKPYAACYAAICKIKKTTFVVYSNARTFATSLLQSTQLLFANYQLVYSQFPETQNFIVLFHIKTNTLTLTHYILCSLFFPMFLQYETIKKWQLQPKVNSRYFLLMTITITFIIFILLKAFWVYDNKNSENLFFWRKIYRHLDKSLICCQ